MKHIRIHRAVLTIYILIMAFILFPVAMVSDYNKPVLHEIDRAVIVVLIAAAAGVYGSRAFGWWLGFLFIGCGMVAFVAGIFIDPPVKDAAAQHLIRMLSCVGAGLYGGFWAVVWYRQRWGFSGEVSDPVPGDRFTKWVIRAGLGILAVFFVFAGYMATLQSCGAYEEGLHDVKASPAVIKALGSPIQEGNFPGGKYSIGNSSSSAELTIPISGPKGSGRVFLAATETDDKWRFNRLEVRVDGSGDTIDLLKEKKN